MLQAIRLRTLRYLIGLNIFIGIVSIIWLGLSIHKIVEFNNFYPVLDRSFDMVSECMNGRFSREEEYGGEYNNSYDDNDSKIISDYQKEKKKN